MLYYRVTAIAGDNVDEGIKILDDLDEYFFFPTSKPTYCTYYRKKYQKWQWWLNDNYDGDNGDFDDNDEENDQKTYKYYDFSIKNPNI